MTTFFDAIRENRTQNTQLERERQNELKSNQREEYARKLAEVKENAVVAINTLNETVVNKNGLSEQQKSSLDKLIKLGERAVDESKRVDRIHELTSIVTWADNVLNDKPVDNNKIYPLLEKEMNKTGGFYNNKIGRVMVGIGLIIAGVAMISLTVGLFTLFPYSPGPNYDLRLIPAAVGASAILAGLIPIFESHELNLSSELRSVTQNFDITHNQDIVSDNGEGVVVEKEGDLEEKPEEGNQHRMN